jgi:hypothetical protein
MKRQCANGRLFGSILFAAVAAVATPARVGAQWGYGYGYGGWGWGGYGGFGAMGMSLYDQEMVKASYYMQSAAAYNVMNAQSAQSYASANLMQQQAINTALQNQQLSSQIAQDKYNLYNQAKNQAMEQARASAPRIPLSALIGSDGAVNWPEVAPSGGNHGDRRQAAEAAIRTAYLSFRQSGQAGVTAVVAAKRALHEYGEPALTLLRARGDTRGRADLVQFLQALEAALDAMGNPPPSDNGGNGDTPKKRRRG